MPGTPVGDAGRTNDEPSIPSRPFQNVAADLFEFEGRNHPSLQYFYSRYIDVERLYETRAYNTMGYLRKPY